MPPKMQANANIDYIRTKMMGKNTVLTALNLGHTILSLCISERINFHFALISE